MERNGGGEIRGAEEAKQMQTKQMRAGQGRFD